MKKIILLIVCSILFYTQMSGQAPEKFQYQLIVRDGNGDLVVNTPLTIKINILDSQQTSAYEEIHSVTTSDQGLVVLVVGDGTTGDDFSDITWAGGSHFISVAIDDGSGSGFVQYSTSELLSVPYALVANSVSTNNTVSILDYGATPFFPVDPNIAEEDLTPKDDVAIQAAIDQNPGKRILFPAGKYTTENPIRVREQVEIAGEGQNVTIIQSRDCDGFIVTTGGVRIKDLWVWGSGTSGSGIHVRDVRNTTLENIKIQDNTVGVTLFKTWNTLIDNLEILYNNESLATRDGVRLAGKSVDTRITNSHISVMDFGVHVMANSADPSSPSEGLVVGDSFIWGLSSCIYSKGLLSMHVSNCILDLCEGYAVNVTKTNGMLLSNNWISDHKNGPQNTQGINVVESNDVHILNNNIITNEGVRGITLTNVKNGTITSNSIHLDNSYSTDFIYLGLDTEKIIIKNNNMRSTNPNLGANGIVNQSGNTKHIIKDNFFPVD